MVSLRMLSFRVIIPNSRGTQQDNRAFTRSIKDLWTLLKLIKDKYPKLQALKLRVRLSAQPSDPVRNFCSDLLDFVNDRNLIRIPEDLPPLTWVDGFSFVETYHDIHSTALRRLTSRFQSLTYFEGHLSKGSVQIRSDVAQEISNLSLACLSELVFDFGRKFGPFQNISSHSSDAFSMAVHRLLQSPNLLKVTLGYNHKHGGVRFTPGLFWPQLEEFGGWQDPFWPCLQSIKVMISSVSPDGT